jgi:class 3 adenylate cyclase
MEADQNRETCTLKDRLEFRESLLKAALNHSFQQEQKVNNLMRNILPVTVAERLTSGEKTISDSCPNATILFGDIVGFSAMSSKKSAEDLVFLLNDLFSKFDRRATALGLEKIKTIGDAYMVAGGLVNQDSEDAIKVVEMAFCMFNELSVFNQKHDMNLGIRVGISSGPVVAGVIGESKFSYDLWGNTVNTASRMESTSLPGKIQISPSTYAQVNQYFDIQERELIECKGLGKIMTYFVNGPLAK